MTLNELISPWTEEIFPDVKLSGLSNDSRQVGKEFLFIAYPGTSTDGRLYMHKAIEAGAAAILYEPENGSAYSLPHQVPCIPVRGLEHTLASIAARFYGYPAQASSIIGVTGTNGKTTIAYQLADAYTKLGKATAYIGTLGEGAVDALHVLSNTTPDALRLQALFSNYHQSGINQVCMEVSSHALCQGRVDEIPFSQAIFSNLTHDHLDYHRTLLAYAEAKARLFATSSLEWAIINEDDKYSKLMRESIVNSSCKLLSYGFSNKADLFPMACESTVIGTHFQLKSPWGEVSIQLRALGNFNVYNALAICGSLLAKGHSLQEVARVVETLRAVPGRMEIVCQEPWILVDYAHTPDALERALRALSQLKKGKLLVVFGCGGDRDKEKRPLMGKIAGDYAERIFLTNDNPRNEDPFCILSEIAAGISQKTLWRKIPDRNEAILAAIAEANKEDIILIAGKGHETYQQIGAVRYPFSDQAVVKAAFSV